MTSAAYSIVASNADESTRLRGVDRVAALLLSIDGARATRVIQRFNLDEVRKLARAVADLEDLDQSDVDTLVSDFLQTFSSGKTRLGGVDKVQSLLSEALPPNQAADVLSDILPATSLNVWEAISEVPEAAMAQYLQQEHTLIATYILSRLDGDYVSKVVALLPRELRNEALARMVSPLNLTESAVRVIEDAVRIDLLRAASNSAKSSSCTKVATIINNLDPEESDAVMRDMSNAYPSEARMIRKMLFSFDDLPRLSRQGLSTLIDLVPQDRLVLALRGKPVEFRDTVLSTMGARSRRLVESELSNPAAAQPSESTNARKEIAALVLSLAQRGEIEIPTSDDVAIDPSAAL